MYAVQPCHGASESWRCIDPEQDRVDLARGRHQIDPAQSWMVGDAERDVLAGHKAGVRTIHITNQPHSPAEKTVTSLLEAAQYILTIQ